MDLNPEDALCNEFETAIAQMLDDVREAFTERFKEVGAELDIITFQALATVLGETEGLLLTAGVSMSRLSDLRQLGMAEGLEREIRFHREDCKIDNCEMLDRLMRARKRFDPVVAKIETKRKASDQLLEQMLTAFESVQKARG